MTRDTDSLDRRQLLEYLGLAGAAGLAGCAGTGDPEPTSGSGGSTGTEAATGTTGGGTATIGGGSTTSGDNATSGGTATSGGGMSGEMADSVEVWSWDVAAKSLDLTNDPYQEEHGGSVTVNQIGRADMKDKFKSTLLSGSGAPGAATMESVDAAAWVATDGLRDVSDWLDDAGVKEEFISGKWEPLTKEGKVYALPWDIGPVGTFYRRDVLEEHDVNLDDVETWEQFLAKGDKLPDDLNLTNLPPNDYDGIWRMLFRQIGGQPFTEDGKVNIGSEKSRKAAETVEMIDASGTASSLAGFSTEWFSALGKGSTASITTGSWIGGTLKAELPDTAGKWGVLKPPALEEGGSRATNWGGSNLTIADQVDDSVARRAWDYMRFTLANKEMQVQMYNEYGLFPSYKPAYESDAFDTEDDFYDGQATGRLFAELAPDIKGYRYTPDTPAVTKAINSHLRDMVNGNATPKEAVEAAAQQVADRTDRDLA